MKFAIAALIPMLLLTACSSTGFNKSVAPSVVEYLSVKQEAAAKEISSGSCPTLTEFMQDYCVMRDQSRVLRGDSPTCTNKAKLRNGTLAR